MKKKVLIVEDDADIADLEKDALICCALKRNKKTGQPDPIVPVSR